MESIILIHLKLGEEILLVPGAIFRNKALIIHSKKYGIFISRTVRQVLKLKILI